MMTWIQNELGITFDARKAVLEALALTIFCGGIYFVCVALA